MRGWLSWLLEHILVQRLGSGYGLEGGECDWRCLWKCFYFFFLRFRPAPAGWEGRSTRNKGDGETRSIGNENGGRGGGRSRRNEANSHDARLRESRSRGGNEVDGRKTRSIRKEANSLDARTFHSLFLWAFALFTFVVIR